jgi:hypothetical protein
MRLYHSGEVIGQDRLPGGGDTSQVSIWIPLKGGDFDEYDLAVGGIQVDPVFFLEPTPTVNCYGPCVVNWPPETQATLRTVEFQPVTTSIPINGTMVSVVLSPSPS